MRLEINWPPVGPYNKLDEEKSARVCALEKKRERMGKKKIKLKNEEGKNFDARDDACQLRHINSNLFIHIYRHAYTYAEKTHTYPIDLPFAVRFNTHLPYSYIYLCA